MHCYTDFFNKYKNRSLLINLKVTVLLFSMNTTQIKKVMKKYKDAWEKQDSNLILECFTKNGIYQERPYEQPNVPDITYQLYV